MSKSPLLAVVLLTASAGAAAPLPEAAAQTAILKVPPFKDAYGDPLPPGAVARFGTIRFRHGQYVRSIAYSPDGKELASSSYDGTIRFWDPKTGIELRRFSQQFDSPGRIAYTAGGKELIVVEGTWYDAPGQKQNRGARVWDVATGKLVRTLTGDGRDAYEARRMATTPSGDRAAFVRGSSVLVLDPTQPGESKTSVAIEVEDAREVTHVSLTEDGRKLSVGAILRVEGAIDREKQPSCVRVYDLQTKKQLWERKGVTGNGHGAFPAAAFSPDGKSLAVSYTYNEQMALVDAATGATVRSFSSKIVGFWPFRFTADGAKLYVTGWGDANEIWDVKTGSVIGRWSRGGGTIFELALSPDGQTMASAERRKIRIMKADTGLPAVTDRETAAEVDHIQLHPDGSRLLAGGYWNPDAGFTVWDRKTSRRLFDYPKSATSFSLAPDSKTVAVGSARISPELFNLEGKKVTRATAQKDTTVRWLSYSPDGSRIVHYGWFGSKIHEIDPDTMESRLLLQLPNDSRVAGLAFFPTGGRIAVAVPGSNVVANTPDAAHVDIWELASKQKVRSLRGLVGGYPLIVAVSLDGRRVAAGSAEARYIYAGGIPDTRILVWDADRGAEIAALPGGVNGHRCVAFSPDGRTIAAGGEDHTVYLWELATATVRAKLIGHEGPVTAVAFAPDGRTLYTGSSDTTVLAWNLAVPPTEPVDAATAWTDLSAADGMKADRAMRTLLTDPAATVAKLSRDLKKAPPVDEAAIKKLIVNLDSTVFTTREAATKMLIRIGRVCVPFLRDAVKTSGSLELSRRADELIRILDDQRLTGDALRQFRTVELLERIDTADARSLLRELATGGRGHVLTEEARTAVGRLGKK